jgi:Ca2+-binding RTX toxin-like protein
MIEMKVSIIVFSMLLFASSVKADDTAFYGTAGDDEITVAIAVDGYLEYVACVNDVWDEIHEAPYDGADDYLYVYTYNGDEKVTIVNENGWIACGGEAKYGYSLSYWGDCPNVMVYGGGTTTGNKVIYGGICDEWLLGGGAADWIYGGGGEDTIYGYEGNDYLFGEDQDDVIYGGGGSDTIFGGFGFDRIYSGNDNDCVSDSTWDALDCGSGSSDYQTSSVWGANCEYKVGACFPLGPPF